MSGPVQEALRNDVKLVMYGENGELEYGGDINTLNFKGMPWDYYDKIYFSASLDKLSKIAKEHGYFNYYKIDFKEKNLDIFKLPEKNYLLKTIAISLVGIL